MSKILRNQWATLLLVILVMELTVYYREYTNKPQEEFICTDSSCERSEVPRGDLSIPNLYNKESEEFLNV